MWCYAVPVSVTKQGAGDCVLRYVTDMTVDSSRGFQ